MNIFQLETILDELQELRELRKATRQKIVDDYHAEHGEPRCDSNSLLYLNLLSLQEAIENNYINNRPITYDDVSTCCLTVQEFGLKGFGHHDDIWAYAMKCDVALGIDIKNIRKSLAKEGVK